MSSRSFKGFGQLQEPKDLLNKLRSDFDRLMKNSEDEFAAFDFFVTALHMLDWVNPGNDLARRAEEAKSPLLRVCSHLANGAKHFEAKAKQHCSVRDVFSEEGVFQKGIFQGNAFQVGGLYINLEGEAALLFGKRVEVVEFARMVLSHWESDPRI